VSRLAGLVLFGKRAAIDDMLIDTGRWQTYMAFKRDNICFFTTYAY
jgi:hypothetical protein